MLKIYFLVNNNEQIATPADNLQLQLENYQIPSLHQTIESEKIQTLSR
jgi:hypothetical protein